MSLSQVYARIIVCSPVAIAKPALELPHQACLVITVVL